MDDLAAVHDIDAVRHFERGEGVLLDDEARDALGLQAADGGEDVLHDLGRQALAGLVEQDEAGRPEERARDRHHLELAAGHHLAVARDEVGERGEDVLHLRVAPCAEAGAAGAQEQVAAARQHRENAPVVRHPADTEARDSVRRRARDVAAVETDGTAPWWREAKDGADCRRLAGAVGAEEGDDLRLADSQRRAEQRLRLAVEGLDGGDLEHQASSPISERATHLFARSASGVSSAMTWPQWITEMRSASVKRKRMSCSIMTMV